MSKAEILAELPRLSPQERGEVLDHLWRLEETAGPTGHEAHLLDEDQAAYEATPAAGAAWPEVEARLRRRP